MKYCDQCTTHNKCYERGACQIKAAAEPKDVAHLASPVMQSLMKMIEAAPDVAESPEDKRRAGLLASHICSRTGMPKRYREGWERPVDAEWCANFAKIMSRLRDGGLVALTGRRGTGKTRLSAEAMRDIDPEKSAYTTAMGLFIRIRASYGKKAPETEEDIIKELSKAPLLVIDEIQERGNSEWEDRLLTHLLDKRYGNLLPTIVIANLTEAELIACMGASITSRLHETGGILEMNGPSHRLRSPETQTPPSDVE